MGGARRGQVFLRRRTDTDPQTGCIWQVRPTSTTTAPPQKNTPRSPNDGPSPFGAGDDGCGFHCLRGRSVRTSLRTAHAQTASTPTKLGDWRSGATAAAERADDPATIGARRFQRMPLKASTFTSCFARHWLGSETRAAERRAKTRAHGSALPRNHAIRPPCCSSMVSARKVAIVVKAEKT